MKTAFEAVWEHGQLVPVETSIRIHEHSRLLVVILDEQKVKILPSLAEEARRQSANTKILRMTSGKPTLMIMIGGDRVYQRGDVVVCVLSGDHGKPRQSIGRLTELQIEKIDNALKLWLDFMTKLR